MKFALPIALAVLLCGSACALAQELPPYVSLEHRSGEQMSSADALALRANENGIRDAAKLFGYDLDAAGWRVDQTLCPAMPNELLLHYRRQGEHGEYLFTALLSGATGEIHIVPVSYNGNMPFTPAFKNSRNHAVFNRIIPGDVGIAAARPSGEWLLLGLCYAETVGVEPRVRRDPEAAESTLKAEPPTLRTTAEHTDRQVDFTDVNTVRGYAVWSITIDGLGHVVTAALQRSPDYVPWITNPNPAQARILPPLPEPPAKIVHPASDLPLPKAKKSLW